MNQQAIVTSHGEWEGIAFTVTCNPDWLGLGISSHIEVRAEEPLPFTETGYRSIFLPHQAVEAAGGALAYVKGFLEESARRPVWKQLPAGKTAAIAVLKPG